ncbi:hypothetical protein FJT64_007775 [Amphibalanus amphitrite]|uniref:Uncharacterized protein n=1 Tax=Amphibalanus amphitrite TaxID=1232801 RepID=A0A6A4VYM7_AMPAM|nr:hypothetical protein FJT64_007775 [Amphibalanus amphitrite]
MMGDPVTDQPAARTDPKSDPQQPADGEKRDSSERSDAADSTCLCVEACCECCTFCMCFCELWELLTCCLECCNN